MNGYKAFVWLRTLKDILILPQSVWRHVPLRHDHNQAPLTDLINNWTQAGYRRHISCFYKELHPLFGILHGTGTALAQRANGWPWTCAKSNLVLILILERVFFKFRLTYQYCMLHSVQVGCSSCPHPLAKTSIKGSLSWSVRHERDWFKKNSGNQSCTGTEI